ncbi:MAG: FMN-binding protein [Clostridium argentinense]|uniref:FMN-binding protein n=1 Tax=Clostridium faecium TaxID=2762223 RepID=A0ABR8YP48_9CLOT|nr:MULTISPECIES: FMN-binding protein [Clostridium]MBD8046019.1 FMN-binding protein [Clostridium faecium]MBS5822868.1 FMN-binding protein [Clostridium argentinense]MDU1349119.1 FMN-binding protein [Clostridium argentinense]
MKKVVSILLSSILAVGVLVGCGSKEAAAYKDGSYEGTGKGFKNDIKVSVEVKDGKIEDIKVVDQKETEGLGDTAIDEIIKKVKEKQSTDEVEAVSGATGSSKGVLEAINNALNQAK